MARRPPSQTIIGSIIESVFTSKIQARGAGIPKGNIIEIIVGRIDKRLRRIPSGAEILRIMRELKYGVRTSTYYKHHRIARHTSTMIGRQMERNVFDTIPKSLMPKGSFHAGREYTYRLSMDVLGYDNELIKDMPLWASSDLQLSPREAEAFFINMYEDTFEPGTADWTTLTFEGAYRQKN